MPPKLPTLDDTISIYKSKFLIDSDDENDHPAIGAGTSYDYDHDSNENTNDLRTESNDDSFDAKDSNRGRKSRLPKDLAGLMGQANVSFARGDYNDAILMCQEVIRLAPRCADPFISLAEHYHEVGDEEKAEQLYLIAAYLQPSNSHLWVRVSESATKRREFRLAATCLTKAIRAEKNESCASFHMKRCNLYEKLGDQKKALKGYENLISSLGPKDDEFGLDLARGIARIYLAENKIDDTIRTIEGTFEKYSTQLSADDISTLANCYNMKEWYVKTLDLMVKKSNIKIKLGKGTASWNMEQFNDCLAKGQQQKLKLDPLTINSRFTFRNRCLLLVALIGLGYTDETIDCIRPNLDKIDIQEHRDSLFEVAQAFYSKQNYQEAKKILFKLTSIRESHAATIWLLYSQCLKNLNEIDEAIEAYKRVLSFSPEDFSSRLALSNLFSVQGRIKEALEVTEQPLFTDTPVDIPLLLQSCQLLYQSSMWPEYCQSAKALLLTDMIYVHHQKEIMCMITAKSLKTRSDHLRFVQRELNSNTLKNRQKSTGPKLDASAMMDIFLKYTHVLHQILKDPRELKNICFSAYTSGVFECYESSIDFYTSVCCIIYQDKEFSYNHLKLLASRNPENNQLWNLFGVAMSNITQDLRHHRFCIRQSEKNPEIMPLTMLKGHNNLMSGSYKQALDDYITLFKEKPNDPLTVFCIALTFLSLSCQRYVSSKYLCLFQMIAFLHGYLELRGTCQETMYNIGRVFHQMNMVDKAVRFYKRALDMKPINPDLDVSREAAFNLALIYRNSESHDSAYDIIKRYFTI